MALTKEKHLFQDILHSLDIKEKLLAGNLHEFMVSLGYKTKITAMGKKENDWKCEYLKNKNVLLILRITDEHWSIRLKLFHLPNYEYVLKQCNKHIIENLLSNSKDCENHGGGCAGPISFSIDGKEYSKCRHYILLKDIMEEDIENIKLLLRSENDFVK
jgi:hypothetical protein